MTQLALRMIREQCTGLPEVDEIVELAYRPGDWHQARVIEISDSHLVAEFFGPPTEDRPSKMMYITGYKGSVEAGYGRWWRRPGGVSDQRDRPVPAGQGPVRV